LSDPGLPDRPIAARWAALRRAGRTGLIPYLTAGYPTPAATQEALQMLVREGCDFIELGIPFSDPVADGPVIQRASHQALEGGMTVRGVLDLVATAASSGAPIIVFTYLNPVLRYGLGRFLAEAAACGAHGILITDLPAGADPEVEDAARGSGLDLIRLVAPTTPPHRLDRILADATGFVYLISRLGVTGRRTEVTDALSRQVAAIRARTDLPVAVGFGVTDGTQARSIAQFADGVVVGSALVERLERGLEPARALVTELRQSLDAVPVP
jgi:tryptophan synthase alpha chain